MRWEIRNDAMASVNLQIDDVFLLWFINKAQSPAIKNFLFWKDTKLHGDMQHLWLTELRNVMELYRSDARQHFSKGNKLPKDPQLREQILSDLADRYLDKHHPDWFLMKDLEAFLELALSTESVIHCF